MLRRILRLVSAVASIVLLTTLATPPQAVAATWLTAGTSWTSPDAGHTLVTNLRYAKHDSYDRVVVDLYGPLPSYSTGYAWKHTYDGSGAAVPIRGGLWLTLVPAYAHKQDGSIAYKGPKLARPGFPALKELAFTGDFEGHVSFAFGLDSCDGRVAYRILRLSGPNRIAIDFRHPSC